MIPAGKITFSLAKIEGQGVKEGMGKKATRTFKTATDEVIFAI